MAARKSGLGKGLDALFLDNASEESQGVQMVKLSEVESNKNQPRKDFDQEALMQLADSIRQHGVLQPVLVRPIGESRYQIVAGERRWRASRMAGLSEIPVIVKEIDEAEVMQIALIENLQREDLNAIEEALGYHTLMEDYQMTQDDVSKRVGKSRPAVANALRLLSLPPRVSAMVRGGDISAGHARALLGLEDETEMEALADKIVRTGMSVREVEKAVGPKKKRSPAPGRDFEMQEDEKFFAELEAAMNTEFGRKVKIHQKNGSGMIEIQFFSKEDLCSIAEKLGK